MKLIIKSEPINNSTLSSSRSETFEITDSEASLLIDWDYEQQCVDPAVKKPVRRSVQEVADAQFSRPDYNSWHNYHRQDRAGAKLSSFEVWNEHGDQEAGAAPSAEDVLCERETADDHDRVIAALGKLFTDLIEDLPDEQRAVFIAIRVQNQRAVDVADVRGVSPAAISKSLRKATERVRAGLQAAGVNSADLSGLPLSGTPGAAQEGRTS